MELILTDAMGIGRVKAEHRREPDRPTNAMKSSSGKQVEQNRTGTPSWQERNLGRREAVWSEAPERRGYEPGSWQERNISSGKATRFSPRESLQSPVID